MHFRWFRTMGQRIGPTVGPTRAGWQNTRRLTRVTRNCTWQQRDHLDATVTSQSRVTRFFDQPTDGGPKPPPVKNNGESSVRRTRVKIVSAVTDHVVRSPTTRRSVRTSQSGDKRLRGIAIQRGKLLHRVTIRFKRALLSGGRARKKLTNLSLAEKLLRAVPNASLKVLEAIRGAGR
jgi:hypothetical protein